MLNVLTSLFSHKSELVEKSEIMDSDTLVNINLGKLLKAQRFEEYTNFMYTTTCEQFVHSREQFDDLTAKVETVKTQSSLSSERIEKAESRFDKVDERIDLVQREIDSLRAKIANNSQDAPKIAVVNDSGENVKSWEGKTKQS